MSVRHVPSRTGIGRAGAGVLIFGLVLTLLGGSGSVPVAFVLGLILIAAGGSALAAGFGAIPWPGGVPEPSAAPDDGETPEAREARVRARGATGVAEVRQVAEVGRAADGGTRISLVLWIVPTNGTDGFPSRARHIVPAGRLPAPGDRFRVRYDRGDRTQAYIT
ncbi:MAG: hypothetical protein P8Z68_10480, partial [Kineosporiaceae bacterium]